MNGLVLRTLQVFLQDTYGIEAWQEVAACAAVEPPEFEIFQTYDMDILRTVLDCTAQTLNKPVESCLEDAGTYLVSHPNCEALRRLMRYGGVDFVDFLYSLEDLPDRARLAIADLTLPALDLHDRGGGRFDLRVRGPVAGFGHVLVGVLRAMADDYGALALLEHRGRVGEFETVSVRLVAIEFAAGRNFDLASRTVRKATG